MEILQTTISGVQYKRLRNSSIQIRDFPITEGSKGLAVNEYLISASIANENGDVETHEDLFLMPNDDVNELLSSRERIINYTTIATTAEFSAY